MTLDQSSLSKKNINNIFNGGIDQYIQGTILSNLA